MENEVRYFRPDENPKEGSPSKFRALIPLLLSVVYGISPIDLIPDIIPLLGLADDVGVLVVGVLLTLLFLVRKSKNRNNSKKPQRF